MLDVSAIYIYIYILQYIKLTFFTLCFLHLKISTSVPCRGSVRTEIVSTHLAASNVPARPVRCWSGIDVLVRMWVFSLLVLPECSNIGLSFLNQTLLSPPSDSDSPAEQGQCFLIASESRGCEHPLPTYLTQEICCCTVGKAWGRNCERCPQVGTGEWYHSSRSCARLSKDRFVPKCR